MSVRLQLKSFLDSTEDVDEKAFLESWLAVDNQVHQLRDRYMRVRSTKASRIIDLTTDFTLKLGTWIDYRLPKYQHLPWYTYVLLVMYHQKFSIEHIKGIANELETKQERLVLAQNYKNMTAILNKLSTLNASKPITNQPIEIN